MCSETCSIGNTVDNILCNDNGTPLDPSDDTYTFDVTVTGSNTGVSWTSNDPNGTTGAYSTVVSFGPYAISSGDLNFTIVDLDDPMCTTDVQVTAPSTCSDACAISAAVSNVLCNDNGTPLNPSDDTYTFDVTVSGMGNGLSWTANDPGGSTGNYGVMTNFGPYPISGGSVSLVIADIDDAGCTAPITVTPPSACSDCQITVELGDELVLGCLVPTSEVTAVFMGVDPADAIITWNGPDPSLQNGQASQSIELAGTYYVTISDSNGCNAVDSIIVSNGIQPTAMIEGESMLDCSTRCVFLTGSADIADVSYVWSGPGVSLDNSGNQTISVCEAGIFDLIVINNMDGCESPPVSITVTENSIFTLLINGDEQEIEFGETANLEIFYDISSSEIDTIVWTPSICDGCESIDVQPTETTTYSVEVVDINGCVQIANATVAVRIGRDVYIPNAFSPNGDGRNDIFSIYSDDLLNVNEIGVFDRWGNNVFKRENLAPDGSEGWNGTFRGEAMNPGVFTYFARVTFLNGREEILSGSVTLLK